MTIRRIMLGISTGLLAISGFASAQTNCAQVITTVNSTAKEQQAHVQLKRLLADLPVDSWLLTRTIRIEEGVIPHSHPVLTLNTRHLDDDARALATLMHEQMHWWIDGHAKEVRLAKRDLRRIYSSLPVGYPEGANDEDASYEHLLINWLEVNAMKSLLGEEEARRVLSLAKKDHYRRLYSLVEVDREKIGAIVTRRALLFSPASLPQSARCR